MVSAIERGLVRVENAGNEKTEKWMCEMLLKSRKLKRRVWCKTRESDGRDR